ncbi:unnamed protein product, partial [Mesorhabditis spiculigera]
MISEETTRSLHMIEGPIGLLLNLLALYLIATKSKNMGGKYPHLLFAFCSCNLALIVIDMLTLPANLVSGQTYLLFAHRTVLGDRQLTYWLLLAYCCTFAQILVLLMFQFMYRYSIVDRNSFFGKQKVPRVVCLCVGLSVLVCTLWTLDVHIFNNAVTAEPSVYMALSSAFSQTFGKDLVNFAATGNNFSPSQNPHYLRTYLVTIFLVVILGCTWNIIILAGYKIYRLLSQNVMASKTTKRLQKELFHALVIQLLIPLFCSYIPLGCIFSSAMLDLPIDISFACILVLIDPILEPIAIIYLIKCYRRAIIGWIRKTKEEPVATISNTSQSGPISTTKRHTKNNETNPLTN